MYTVRGDRVQYILNRMSLRPTELFAHKEGIVRTGKAVNLRLAVESPSGRRAGRPRREVNSSSFPRAFQFTRRRVLSWGVAGHGRAGDVAGRLRV